MVTMVDPRRAKMTVLDRGDEPGGITTVVLDGDEPPSSEMHPANVILMAPRRPARPTKRWRLRDEERSSHEVTTGHFLLEQAV